MTIYVLLGKIVGTGLAYLIGFYLIKKSDENYEKKKQEIHNLKMQNRWDEAISLENKLYKL